MELVQIGSDRYEERDSVKDHIIDFLGEDIWTLLTERLGGYDIKIPKKANSLHPQHELVLALGMTDATLLISEFFGESLFIPKAIKPSSVDLCLAGVKEGLTTREIASKIGMTERGVRMALQRAGLQNPNRADRRARGDAGSPSDASTQTRKPLAGPPRVSNGGLTGLGRISGIIPAPANENRPTAR